MTKHENPLAVSVLGATGRVGRHIVRRALARGDDVACQSRARSKLVQWTDRTRVHAFDPRDGEQLGEFVKGADVVVFALGVDSSGPTTLFSEVTAALISAMSQQRVRRLIAITGVGAGDTRGHGGFVYDRIIYPLFTRNRYRDKERQEALIAASDLDWIIVRPAPFSERASADPIQVHTRVAPETVLRRVTHDEVADFVVQQFGSDRYLRQRLFIGHP